MQKVSLYVWIEVIKWINKAIITKINLPPQLVLFYFWSHYKSA